MLSPGGCGSDNPGDRVMKEEIAVYHDTAAIDEKSAPADQNEMKRRTDEFVQRIGEIERKRKELNLSAEEAGQVYEKYREERAKAIKRLQDAQKNFDVKTRQGFVGRLSTIRPGMSAREVRSLLGEPDDVRTRLDPDGWIGSPAKEAWCYGTHGHLTLPTLGSVEIDRNGSVVHVDGGRKEAPPAGLIQEEELREILRRLRRVEGRGPLGIIHTVNTLQPLEKEKVFAVLGECDRLGSGFGPLRDALLVLFEVPEVPGHMPPQGIGATMPKAPKDPRLIPRFPVALEDDIPINLVWMISLRGHPLSFDKYLSEFQSFEIRHNPLRPTDAPLDIYHGFATRYRDFYGSELGAKEHVIYRLLELLDSVYQQPADKEDGRPRRIDDPDGEWKKLADAFSKRPIHWNEEKMIYTFLDGSTLPTKPRKLYPRHVWEVEDGPRETVLTMARRNRDVVDITLEQSAPNGLRQIPVSFAVYLTSGDSKLISRLQSRDGDNIASINTFVSGEGVHKCGDNLWCYVRSTSLNVAEGEQIRVELTWDSKPKENRHYRL
jgi:hypothetical protein